MGLKREKECPVKDTDNDTLFWFAVDMIRELDDLGVSVFKNDENGNRKLRGAAECLKLAYLSENNRIVETYMGEQ